MLQGIQKRHSALLTPVWHAPKEKIDDDARHNAARHPAVVVVVVVVVVVKCGWWERDQR